MPTQTLSRHLHTIAPTWKCPAVVYGPGDSALDHPSDEHISLEEYGKAVTVLASAEAGCQVITGLGYVASCWYMLISMISLQASNVYELHDY
jgi:hypothetical protein